MVIYRETAAHTFLLEGVSTIVLAELRHVGPFLHPEAPRRMSGLERTLKR